MSETYVKTQLQVPDLPSVVQGDGRHVMALLRRYLKEMAVQINLSNDFEGLPETDEGLAAPNGFVLRFGVDGGELSWQDVGYIPDLLYYELRTDRNVGSIEGLLEQTTENTSRKLPDNYQATIYLYAVTKDGTYSNPSVLTYTKARPEAPQKINLTKNDQGTLIQFTEIPLNCIGAYIYVNGNRYETTDNIYLYTRTDVIKTVSVAYFDQFGEGERATINCEVLTVTGFIVECNGAVLDFYWEPVPLYGVQYTVQVAEVPQWGVGVELFTTALNKKKLEYPNPGGKYFLIKAFDEHGNYSAEAVWYHLVRAEDPTRNHIITFNEQETAYSGSKLGLYYDVATDSLKFSDELYVGEYNFQGELPKEYLARNWVDFKVITTTEELWYVQDALYPLDDEWATSLVVSGGRLVDQEAVEVKNYIATYEGADYTSVFMATMDGTNVAETGETPTQSRYADTFKSAQYHDGLDIQELTRLSYTTQNKVTQFYFLFSVKLESKLEDGFIARWSGTNGWLELTYEDGFYLNGSDGISVYVPYTWKRLDVLSIGISQGAEERGLYVKSIYDLQGTTTEAKPIGVMTDVQFNKGE